GRDAAIRPQLEHKPTWRGHRECAPQPRHASLNGGEPRSRLRQLGDVAPGVIAAEQVSGPRDVWSVPFKVVGVIQPSSKPKKGATKSLHNWSPPKPISQPPLTTYQILVSFSKNSPATNSRRPVATIATTITNRRASR